MLSSVFAKSIRDGRRAVAWWVAALGATVLLYSSVFPTVEKNAATLDKYIRSFPEAVRTLIGGASFGSPAGYIQAELFSFTAPIVFLVFAIGLGARAIAGEEEDRTLDVLLSTPVRRATIVLDKTWAMCVATLVLAVAMWAAILAFGPAFQVKLGTLNVTAAMLNIYLLAVAFGAIALAVGAATGNRTLAVGVSSGLALATFLINALAPSMKALKSIRRLSPFYWYSGVHPLTNGVDPAAVGVLAGIAVVASLVAVLAFERRDLAS